MNRRDIFKSFIGLSVAGCAGNEIFRLEDKPKMDYKPKDITDAFRITDKDSVTVTEKDWVPYNTDDRYYDEWLDAYSKDDMHL